MMDQAKTSKLVVLSAPRCGSSLVTSLICSSGYEFSLSPEEGSFSSHEFNKKGYFEDVPFTLLNDQLIKSHFGMDFSFLYPPTLEEFTDMMSHPKPNDTYSYDVDENTVWIPEGFRENVQDFTGTDWDVWGITRMIDGGKWQNCYLKNGIKTMEEILKKKEMYKNHVADCDFDIVLKDPRLALTLSLYGFEDIRVIAIHRSKESVKKSMRKHYGPRMFTENYIPGTEYVSNHFNHKVKYMDFDEYYERYERIIQYSVDMYESLTLDFDEIVDMSGLDTLEEFIGKKVDRSIVDLGLVTS